MIRRASGFSLVELLVAVSVIAVLIALLLPALRAARDTAQRVLCQSRMRQVGIAMQVYRSDFGGWHPPQNILPGSLPPPWYDSGSYRFAELIRPYLNTPENLSYTSSADENTYMCPSNNYRYRTGMLFSEMREFIYTSGLGMVSGNYWNTALFGMSESSFRHLPRFDFPGQPSDTIACGEVAGQTATRLGFATNGWSQVAFFHQGRTNFLMLDGHVEGWRQTDLFALGSGFDDSAAITFFDGDREFAPPYP